MVNRRKVSRLTPELDPEDGMSSYPTLPARNHTKRGAPAGRSATTLLPLAGLTLLWVALMAVAFHLGRWPQTWITWVPWGILVLLSGVILGAWLVVASWAWNALQDWRWTRVEVRTLAEDITERTSKRTGASSPPPTPTSLD